MTDTTLLSAFAMAVENTLPVVHRFITTHNAEGKAVFSDVAGDRAEPKAAGPEAVFGLQYCSEEFPAELSNDKDIEVYQKHAKEPPGLVISTGTVLRTVGM